jgi:AsmA protein
MLFRKKNTVTAGKFRSLFRKTLQICLLGCIGLLGLLIAFSVYFYFDRDKIGRKILLHSNQISRGELSFRDISFNPFKHFPELSLTLFDVSYYEHDIRSRHQNEVSLVEVGRLYAAIDISDLLKGDINVSRIYLQEGTIRLVRYPDSTLNLVNAFTLPGKKEKTGRDEPDSSKYALDLRQVTLHGVRVTFDDRVERDNESMTLKRSRASFIYSPDEISGVLDAELDLELVRLSDKILFRDKVLGLQTAFRFQRDGQILTIDPSTLSIDQAILDINGEIDFGVNDKFLLEIDGSDHDFSIFQLFLTRQGLKNLRQGDLFFSGSITGIPGREIPVADFSFGMEDVSLYVPSAKDYIRELHLSGNFYSGSKGDLSEARLDVDTIRARLPSGHLAASLHMEKFNSPILDLMLDMETSLEGLDQVLKLDFIHSLQGGIRTRFVLLDVRKHPDSTHVSADDFAFDIRCNDISFTLPGIMSVNKASGNLYARQDTIWLDNFTVWTGNSDLLINGTIVNALHLPFGIEQEIMADLDINSEVFDLPGFLSFLPKAGESFPYRIKDVSLETNITTSTSRLLEFRANPSIDFQINQLDGTIEGFLPRTSNISGAFSLGEKNSRTFLEFRDFRFDILDGNMQADLELYVPAVRNTWLKMAVETDDVNPGMIFWHDQPDSLPDFLNGPLNTTFQLEMHLPDDPGLKMERLELQMADLHLINTRDTFEVERFSLEASNIYWDTEKHPNLLATLNAEAVESVSRLVTDNFVVDDLNHEILVRDGVFRINTNQSILLQIPGKGEFVFAPFAEIPNYEIRFDMEELRVNDVMQAFLIDTLITGTIDFHLDVVSEGSEIADILSNINGDLVIYGEGLTLYGVDLDEVIKQFKRSQNFNLVDVGAVMFAGPAGLALTKGGAYASLLVTEYGETSPVKEIISDWEFRSGKIILRDVAFSTEETRVAAKGWLDIPNDSLDISFAVIDRKGCNVIGQDLYGSINNPEKSRIQIITTLLAPVTNLLELTLGIECEPFYEGRIEHPASE